MYEYRDVADRGCIQRLNYSVSVDGETVPKYVNVYVPAGYDPKNRYEVLYIMHGGGGNQDAWLDGSMIKNMFDRMIDDRVLRPILVVWPTIYNTGVPKNRERDRSQDRGIINAFPDELRKNIIPLVESSYSTYASDVSEETLRATRDRRAFAGFSLGAGTTWFVLYHAMDIVKTVLPLSGDLWLLDVMGGSKFPKETAEQLRRKILDNGFSKDDIRILCATGSVDLAEPMLSAMVSGLRMFPDMFDEGPQGNFSYYIEEGQRHCYDAAIRYLERLLPEVFPGEEKKEIL